MLSAFFLLFGQGGAPASLLRPSFPSTCAEHAFGAPRASRLAVIPALPEKPLRIGGAPASSLRPGGANSDT